MSADDERDYAEEAYLRAFCPECGDSPCSCLLDAHDHAVFADEHWAELRSS